MIHRMALMKMKPDFDGAALAAMQTHITTIRDKVPGVLSYALVPNVAPGNQGYNYAVLSSFANEADMNAYRSHPLHVAFLDAAEPFTEDFIPVAYEAG